jgi:hypothetical protein
MQATWNLSSYVQITLQTRNKGPGAQRHLRNNDILDAEFALPLPKIDDGAQCGDNASRQLSIMKLRHGRSICIENVGVVR